MPPHRWPGPRAWIVSLLCGLLLAGAGTVSAQTASPSGDRDDELRAALVRIQAAPRVRELVGELLHGDIQVVVVRNAPGGIGAYYPGVAVTGLDHVYRNNNDLRVYYGPRGLIVLDARLEEQATRETIAFVLAHEYAHHHLGRGHTEQHADAFARRLLQHRGMWTSATAGQALGFAAGSAWARWLMPAVAARLRALEGDSPTLAMASSR